MGSAAASPVLEQSAVLLPQAAAWPAAPASPRLPREEPSPADAFAPAVLDQGIARAGPPSGELSARPARAGLQQISEGIDLAAGSLSELSARLDWAYHAGPRRLQGLGTAVAGRWDRLQAQDSQLRRLPGADPVSGNGKPPAPEPERGSGVAEYLSRFSGLGWLKRWAGGSGLEALRGKRILVVWSGFPEQHTVFERMHELGIKVVLVDQPDSLVDRRLVEEFIPIDVTQSTDRLYPALDAVKRFLGGAKRLDGITTFWEDSIVATAWLAQFLNLPYHPVHAAEAARNKFLALTAMRAAGLPTPEFRVFSDPHIRKQKFLEAVRGFPFPAVLKPAFGIEAMSTVKVHSAEEAWGVFTKIAEQIHPDTDPIFSHGRDILLAEYLDGDEVDVDLGMQKGEFVFESMTYNWPTDEPYFVPKGSTLPGTDVLSAQVEARMVDISKRAALALGFEDGVLHVEGKYTSKGPRILEVNGRMGGRWVRDWVKKVWGVDLVDMQLLTAVGLPVRLKKSPTPLTHLTGEFFIPPQSGIYAGFDGLAELQRSPGFYRIVPFKEAGEKVLVPPEGYQRVLMLSAFGSSAEEAERNYQALRPKLRIHMRPLAPEQVPSHP